MAPNLRAEALNNQLQQVKDGLQARVAEERPEWSQQGTPGFQALDLVRKGLGTLGIFNMKARISR